MHTGWMEKPNQKAAACMWELDLIIGRRERIRGVASACVPQAIERQEQPKSIKGDDDVGNRKSQLIL